MGAGIPLDKAELLGTLLEGMLYGFSLLIFGGTIWVLLSRRSARQVNRFMLAVACLLMLCSTVHLIIDITRIMEGLILYRDTYPGGPVAFFAKVSQWTFVSKNCVYTVQSLIGDGVILYRCYVVWKSRLVMVVPTLLWGAACVTGIASSVESAHSGFFDVTLERWVTTFYATTFTTNIVTTFLLTCRIWYVDQEAAGLRGDRESPLRRTLHISIDAGAIYNLTLLALWICFARHSYGQFVVQNMLVPIIAITFYMTIICIGLTDRASHPADSLLPLKHTSSADAGAGDGSRRGADPRRRRMQVHITTWTENMVDHGHNPDYGHHRHYRHHHRHPWVATATRPNAGTGGSDGDGDEDGRTLTPTRSDIKCEDAGGDAAIST